MITLHPFKIMTLNKVHILVLLFVTTLLCTKFSHGQSEPTEISYEDLNLPSIPGYSIPQGDEVIPGINADGLCNIIVGTDYTDPQAFLNDGTQTKVDQDQQCCVLCQQVEGCMSWVFANEDDNVLNRTKGECWLSSGFTNGTRCSLCSSVTFEEFNDTLSYVLEDVLFVTDYGVLNDPSTTYVESAEQCYDICDNTQSCIAWSYIKETDEVSGLYKGQCYLRAFAPSYVGSKFADSGVSLAMKLQMCQPLENTCLYSDYGYLNDPKYSITLSDEECAYLCQRSADCRSWMRIKKDIEGFGVGECILRDWVPMQESCDYANSGVDGGMGPTENVILIIADDLGIDHLSIYADLIGDDARDVYPYTPNINYMMSKGIVFDRAYSNPTCSPTRTALISGKYGFRTGVGYPIGQICQNGLNMDEPTIPKLLPDFVNSACIGKWHMASYGADLDTPRMMGFDRFEGFIDGSIFDYYDWDKTVNGDEVVATYTYCTTDMVDAVRRFFESIEASKWFLWMAFNAPHTPFHKPPTGLHYHDDLLDVDPLEVEIDPVPYFHAMIEALDTEIGRIWDYIPIKHQERTTIIFMGDNGSPPEVSDGQPFDEFHAKETLTEGGVRVPLAITGANVRDPGRRNGDLVNVLDLFTTILELMSVLVDEELGFDSKSIVPVMHNDKEYEKRTWVYAEQFGPNRTCDNLNPDRYFVFDYGQILREERFKLHYPFYYDEDVEVTGEEVGVAMMYDVIDDPWEKNNLLDENGEVRTDLDSEYAATVQAKKDELDDLFEKINLEKVIDDRTLESFASGFEDVGEISSNDLYTK